VVKETIVLFNLRFIEYDGIIYFLDANFYEVIGVFKKTEKPIKPRKPEKNNQKNRLNRLKF